MRHALLVAMLVLASLSMAGVTHGADGPTQQVIIKWRDTSSSKEQQPRTAKSLRQAGARHNVTLQWQRTMGTGAGVYKVHPTLEPPALDALLKTLSSDPNVEYAEADSMLRTLPRR